MTQLHIRRPVGLVLGLASMALSAPLAAASTDYFLKIDDIKGESSKSKQHKQWIELLSLRAVDGGAAQGGVNVAVGDVNGDGATADNTKPAKRRTYEPIVFHKRIDKSAPLQTAPATPDDISTGSEPTPAALLLPAVQKVREAAARMPAWQGCTVGQKLKKVRIMQQSTGRTGRILDARISSCAMEQVSFNFTKITWD